MNTPTAASTTQPFATWPAGWNAQTLASAWITHELNRPAWNYLQGLCESRPHEALQVLMRLASYLDQHEPALLPGLAADPFRFLMEEYITLLKEDFRPLVQGNPLFLQLVRHNIKGTFWPPQQNFGELVGWLEARLAASKNRRSQPGVDFIAGDESLQRYEANEPLLFADWRMFTATNDAVFTLVELVDTEPELAAQVITVIAHQSALQHPDVMRSLMREVGFIFGHNPDVYELLEHRATSDLVLHRLLANIE